MNKIITISIAAYNQEKFLGRCIQSLLVPSLDKVQIIVINDGSTDRTSEIAHEYAAQYPDSIIVIDKVNGHYGSCVNVSLKIAEGKYYRLLDADDYFDSNAFEKYIAALSQTDADMVVTGHVICGNSPIEVLPKNVIIGKVYRQEDIDFRELGMENCLGMHGVTYKKEILKSVGLSLLERCPGTDAEYCYYPIGACVTLQFFDYRLYQYQTGILGQDTSIISDSQREGKFKVAFRMLKDYCKHMACEPKTCQNQRIVLERTVISYYAIYMLHSHKNHADDVRVKTMDKLLRKFAPESYAAIGNAHTYKLPFVRIYRKYGCTSFALVPFYSALRRFVKRKIGEP